MYFHKIEDFGIIDRINWVYGLGACILIDVPINKVHVYINKLRETIRQMYFIHSTGKVSTLEVIP